jgi:hypothetical protein
MIVGVVGVVGVVTGLVVDGGVVTGLVVDGGVVTGLVVDGGVVTGLVVDGGVVTGLVVTGLVVTGLAGAGGTKCATGVIVPVPLTVQLAPSGWPQELHPWKPAPLATRVTDHLPEYSALQVPGQLILPSRLDTRPPLPVSRTLTTRPLREGNTGTSATPPPPGPAEPFDVGAVPPSAML